MKWISVIKIDFYIKLTGLLELSNFPQIKYIIFKGIFNKLYVQTNLYFLSWIFFSFRLVFLF